MTIPNSLDAADLKERSVQVISNLQERNGAYPASPTFSAYRGYCWFRDGAFIADGMSAAGEVDSASAFFGWCSNTVLRNAQAIRAVVIAADAGTPVPSESMLPARFTMQGEPGNDEWWDFQLDGYGTWVWAAVEHAERHNLDLAPWKQAVELTVDYLISSWKRPCYDWWEESQDQIHVSTLACVGAGLEAALRAGLVDGPRAEKANESVDNIRTLIMDRGTHDGHLVKWLGSEEVDASLSAVISPLRFIDARSALAQRTVEEIDQQLSFEGGVHRYLGDVFYGGGQWPLLSCFLGLAKAATGDEVGAHSNLEWASDTVTVSGYLPEQVDRHLLAPAHHDEWVERWGSVATPLLWSHAMYLRLSSELSAP